MGTADFDALLFDFDGVILESVDIKTAAFAALYAEHGAEVVARVRAYHEAHGGVSRYEKFRHYETVLLGRPALTPAREQALGERFAALVVEGVLNAPLVAGIRAVLEHYAGRVPMFVVSGTPGEELRRIVAARALDAYFLEVHGSPTDKITHIADILARHGYAAARTLMIGDALTDHDAARANGTAFLGRVPPREADPFPPGTPTVADFSACVDGSLAAALLR